MNRNNLGTNRKAAIKKFRKQKWKENQLYIYIYIYIYFDRQTKEIAHEMTWTWLIKRNLKLETETLLIAAQIKARGTN